MKILIEEKDETNEYRIIPIDTLVNMTTLYGDRVVLRVPNLCGGETRISIYRSNYPDGNIEALKILSDGNAE